jgi:galactokinase/mevalonate kinase-like predicted kinase
MWMDILHSDGGGRDMEEIVKNLKDRVDALETEVLAMKRIQGVQIEKKDPKAWERLDAIGKEISKSWKSKKQSWQLISESRR